MEFLLKNCDIELMKFPHCEVKREHNFHFSWAPAHAPHAYDASAFGFNFKLMSFDTAWKLREITNANSLNFTWNRSNPFGSDYFLLSVLWHLLNKFYVKRVRDNSHNFHTVILQLNFLNLAAKHCVYVLWSGQFLKYSISFYRCCS